MDYGKILRRSWEIVKNNKILWILGMLLLGSSGGGNGGGGGSDYSSPGKNTGSGVPNNVETFFYRIVDAISAVPIYHWIILGLIIFVVIVIAIVIKIYLTAWAEGAVIGLVNEFEINNEPMTFTKASGHGVKYATDLIWISVLPSLVFGSIFIGMAVIITGIAFIPVVGPIIAILLGILSFLLFMIAILGFTLIKTVAYRVAVIEGKSYKEAFADAFELTKKYFLVLISQGVINYMVGCGFGCLYLIFILIPIGIVALGFVINVGLGIFLLFPALILLIASGIFVGMLNSFKSTNWTLLYREIQSQKESQHESK